MSSPVSFLAVVHCLRTLSLVAVDLIRLVTLAARPRAALVAENLFLRKQLALFQERKVRPRRADASTRWMMAALSQWFAWRDALVNVHADTLLRLHSRRSGPCRNPLAVSPELHGASGHYFFKFEVWLQVEAMPKSSGRVADITGQSVPDFRVW